MRKILSGFLALFLFSAFVLAQTPPVRKPAAKAPQPQASNATRAPGLDVLGFGYDVFGNYADQRSKKTFCLFTYSNERNIPIGQDLYSVPQFVFLENISDHQIKTVSGESIRDYAQSLSVEAGLGVDAMFFKGTVDVNVSGSVSGTEQNYYFTYMDANIKWRISIDNRDLDDLKTILDPKFKRDLATLAPARLFEIYGTHYIARAYLGGRADFSSVSVVSEKATVQEIGIAVTAEYKKVSSNLKMNAKQEQTLTNAKTTTKLRVTGGGSEYMNSISDAAAYNEWAKGIESRPSLADFDANSLRPIWDFCEDPAREALLKDAFRLLCEKNPLPPALANLRAVNNSAYMIRNKAAGTFFDFDGFNPRDAKAGDKLKVGGYDANAIKNQGFDRVYRVETSETEPEYVYIRPQHTNKVLDVTGGNINIGTPIQIYDLNKTNSQLFKLEPVDKEPNTYYIKTKNNLCFEIQPSNSQVVLAEFKASESQKWVLIGFDSKNIAQPNEGGYAIQCVAGANFLDFPGTYPEVTSDKLQLWSPGNAIGDRTFNLSRKGIYYVIRPNHHPSNLLTSKSKHQIFNSKQTNADDQLFSFEYGGSPNAYLIRNKATNEVVAAHGGETEKKGCSVNSWPMGGGDNEKWLLHGPSSGQTPLHEGEYFVKCEQSNKYWDLAGNENESNRNHVKVQIWDLDGGKDRKVQFIPCDDKDLGYYRIKFGNGRFLDVSGHWDITSMDLIDQVKYHAGQSNIKLKKDLGAQLQGYEYVNNDGQKFKIIHVGNNVFCIRSIIENRAIDVTGGKIHDNGPSLQLWNPETNNAAQRFVFINSSNNQQYKYD